MSLRIADLTSVADKSIAVLVGISRQMAFNPNVVERLIGGPGGCGPEWTWGSSRANRDKLLGGGDQDGRRPFISDKEFRERNAALRVERTGSALKIDGLNLFEEENRKAHHTEEYEQEDLIVRRGQKFSLACTFDRNVSVTKDIIILKFSYGARPQESKGTLIRVPVIPDGPDSDLGWNCKVTEVKGKTVKMEVLPDPDCNIGMYSILTETKLKNSNTDVTKDDTKKCLYVLFNAWCEDKFCAEWLGHVGFPLALRLPPAEMSTYATIRAIEQDVVYMAEEKERFEYVLNDKGRIWRGDTEFNWGAAWDFGQFQTPVLDVTLGLLDKGELSDAGRHSAVSIIRCLSALANSVDESGVLAGRWTETYPKDSTPPSAWTGSVAIIEEFHKTGKPVKYGQCWVFSGLVTTLLRALGIPTRSVTNFASAHDHDLSMTIDMHFDEDDKPIKRMNDSTWNFHVWNESFFRRVDLPDMYDGWQIHDATPQESSEGVYRCGPAPLTAIKEGHVYISFDVPFVFAEVNGDMIQWVVMNDGSMHVWYIDRYSVGKQISTKAVGSNLRNDLTNDYKYPDGSAEEKKVVESVNKYSTRRHLNIYKNSTEPEVKWEVILPENCIVGENMTVGVKVTNTANDKRTLRVGLTVASTFYTGVVGEMVKSEKTEVTVEAGKDKEVLMTCSPDEYEKVMNAECLFNLTATCRVLETDKCFAKVQPFSISGGVLTIQVAERISPFTEETAKLTFKNNTNLKLHNAVFQAEGSFLVKNKLFRQMIRKVINPGDEISADVPLYSKRHGEREIVATFSSNELTNVTADATVSVVAYIA